MKHRNVEAATDHKRALEQRQREELKHRNETGVKWDTRVRMSFEVVCFILGAIYVRPLMDVTWYNSLEWNVAVADKRRFAFLKMSSKSESHISCLED